MTAFGRLDIHFPDGNTITYVLEGESITVGSADGNAIIVSEEGVAARHFILRLEEGEVFLTNLDAHISTFVGGVFVPVDAPLQLRNVEQIQVGEINIDFYQRSDSPTVSMQAILDQTQPAEIGFRASIDSSELNVWPFSSASAELSITSLTADESQFSIETAGLPEGWTTPSELTFAVDGRETVQILIQIRPSQHTGMAPGDYPLTVSVTRLGASEHRVQLAMLVRLGGYGGLSLALDPTEMRHNDLFHLFMLNQGNEELQLALQTHDPGVLLDIRLAQDVVRMSPGGRAKISGNVRARQRPLVGSTTHLPFALMAQADNPSAYLVALPAVMTVKPYLSYRALSTLVAALIIVCLVFAAALLQPPEPEITSFALSASQVARGTPLELTWVATDAQTYVIEVNRVAIAELPGDALSFTLDTEDFADPIDIALIALHGELNDIETRVAEVYQPVIVGHFDTDKATMFRNISSTLSIGWQVEGAIALNISRPFGFVTISEESIEDTRGEIVLRGEPAEDFQITLSAEDEIGETTALTISVTVRDPECTPIQDTLLYAGPDSRFPQVNVAVQNVPVLIHGVTDGKDWLQVELASGESGWGFYTGFNCQGFDPGALSVITELPQLPTATPTTSPTATPTPTVTPTPVATAIPTKTPSPAPAAAVATADDL